MGSITKQKALPRNREAGLFYFGLNAPIPVRFGAELHDAAWGDGAGESFALLSSINEGIDIIDYRFRVSWLDGV